MTCARCRASCGDCNESGITLRRLPSKSLLDGGLKTSAVYVPAPTVKSLPAENTGARDDVSLVLNKQLRV